MIRRFSGGMDRFLRAEAGATAVEFALICLVFLGLMLGIIDAGRLAWTLNIDKAATRSGARLAAVSPIVATWLQMPFSGCVNGNGQRLQTAGMPTMTCSATGCMAGAGGASCGPPLTTVADQVTFQAIVDRMRQFDSRIQPANVEIEYDPVGLGVVGDPAGCDASPLVTVRLRNMTFSAGSLQVFGLADFTLPSMSSALTSEHQIQSGMLAASRCPLT